MHGPSGLAGAFEAVGDPRCAHHRGDEGMTAAVGWVLPPTPIRGLDHLGVQAPCVALYTQMLPGITNVTHRARYFSFSPWFIRAFEQRSVDRSEPAFALAVRRAECLLTLIAVRHREVTGETADLHDAAMIGTAALAPALGAIGEGGEIRIDDHAAFECEKRYFKHRWGGFGQYYFGALRDLRIIDYVDGKGPQPAGYDRTRGVALADAYEGGVDTDRFFGVLERGTVALADLDVLVPFCPCALRKNERERELLLDVVLARTPDFLVDGGDARRASLGLLLDGAKVAPAVGVERSLRWGAYSGCLPASVAWTLPERLVRARERWGVYQRNELLSVALQGLFWAVLQAMHHHHRGSLQSGADAGEILIELASVAGWGDRLDWTFDTAVAVARETMPALSDWGDELHELGRAQQVEDIAGRFEAAAEDLAPTVGNALAVLVALVARGRETPIGAPYRDFDFAPDRFGGDEIDLASFQAAQSGWSTRTVREWLRWLATTWGLERHLHVALRKMRADGRDTFRVRPLDDRLQLVEAPPASFTAPRVRCAQQILVDLGLLSRGKDRELELTALGLTELGCIRG